MEEQDQELIERYFGNALSKAEIAEFRRRMSGDTNFREAVQLHEDALEAIRLEGTETLRARLAAKGRELDAAAQKPRIPWLWWLTGIAVALFVAWAIWQQQQPGTPSAPAPAIDNRNIATPQVKDTLPAVSPAEKPPEPAPKTIATQRVFAAYFKPYKDPSLEPARRGDTEQSPSERFQQLYWDGDHRSALAAFDSLGATAQNSDNLLFLRANSLLATGQVAAAGTLLEQLRRRDRSRFSAQYDWYLALCRLHEGRLRDAEILLQRIAADPGSPRRTDAAHLLRDLK